MNSTPPVVNERARVDLEHLKLLAVFHYVFAALALVGLLFLFAHYLLMHTFLDDPSVWNAQHAHGQPPPKGLFAMMIIFYGFFGVAVLACAVGNFLSARFIRRRKHRLYSLVVAGLNCVQFPFGTALGVFSFVVLLRDSVRDLYGE